jgi:hypothetical protein
MMEVFKLVRMILQLIDDLLVKEDPTEKLDLAAYPYL